MGHLVYILGRSGTGKSYSMRNFPKDKLAVINVQGKMLPFKGAATIEQTSTDNSFNILKALDIYSQQVKSIVVDDYQYVMSNEFMRRSSEKGYDKFTEIARHAWDIANKVRELPNDVIVYIMCHTDRDEDGNEKIKTIGRLLDEKICLEGLSTIVLKTNVSDGQYTFLTQNNGKDTVKSPFGMFPTYAIDNDLWYVDQKIRNYYEMPDHVSDEEAAVMDHAVAMPDVQKPDSEGRPRRRSRIAEVDKGTGAIVGATPEEQKAEEQKQRRRKERNDENKEEKPEEAPAEEKKEETAERRTRRQRTSLEKAENQPSDDKVDETPADTGKRRRRRRIDSLMTEDFMNIPEDISDDEVPFNYTEESED